MTLIIAVVTRESIWLSGDRRISYPNRTFRDDARKLMSLQTLDGTAMLGYAGLGATASGVEPAEWMSRVLRGTSASMENSLATMAVAVQRELPQHLRRLRLSGPIAHHVLVPAFVQNETRLYAIELGLAPDRSQHLFRHVKYVRTDLKGTASVAPSVAIAGSGLTALSQDRGWVRDLLRLVKAHNRNRVSAGTVAGRLAEINYRSHQLTSDGTVGDRCIVMWRFRPGGKLGGGGGIACYAGTMPDAANCGVPSIIDGIDVMAVTDALMPLMTRGSRGFTQRRAGQNAPTGLSDLNAALMRVPGDPDGRLR